MLKMWVSGDCRVCVYGLSTYKERYSKTLSEELMEHTSERTVCYTFTMILSVARALHGVSHTIILISWIMLNVLD